MKKANYVQKTVAMILFFFRPSKNAKERLAQHSGAAGSSGHCHSSDRYAVERKSERAEQHQAGDTVKVTLIGNGSPLPFVGRAVTE